MKKSLIALAITAAIPILSEAGPPIPFGQGWAYNNATKQITHSCPTEQFTPTGGTAQARFVCSSTPVSDNNFLQIEITDRQTGHTYFRTVIADSTAASATSPEKFVTESFVSVQNSATGTTGAGSGIAANQVIDSRLVNSGVLTSNTTILTGGFNNNTTERQVSLRQDVWSDGSANPEFHAGFAFDKNINSTVPAAVTTTSLDQHIRTAGTDPFADSFQFTQNRNINDVVTGTSLDILTGVALNGAAGTLNDQEFAFIKRDGTFVNGTGTASMPGQANLTWAVGNSLERVYIPQTVQSTGSFGYERITDNTAPVENLSAFSLGSVGPFATITPTTGTNPFARPAGYPVSPGQIVVPPPPTFQPL